MDGPAFQGRHKMTDLQAFNQRIGSVPISLSIFEDRHGYWAKDMTLCVRVRIEFEDGMTVFLTPEEFKALPKWQQDLVRHAPSSPSVP